MASRSRSAARWPPIPALLTLLVGLGLTEFSMAPTAIAVAKQLLRGVSAAEARRVAGRALRAGTPADVEKALTDILTPQDEAVKPKGNESDHEPSREALGLRAALGEDG